jgi:hypothetical protein
MRRQRPGTMPARKASPRARSPGDSAFITGRLALISGRTSIPPQVLTWPKIVRLPRENPPSAA